MLHHFNVHTYKSSASLGLCYSLMLAVDRRNM